MRLLSSGWLGATILLLGIPAVAAPSARDCSGNACNSVSVSWDGTCYTAKNIGAKHIFLDFTYLDTSKRMAQYHAAKSLDPGDSYVPKQTNNRCVAPYRWYRADFQ